MSWKPGEAGTVHVRLKWSIVKEQCRDTGVQHHICMSAGDRQQHHIWAHQRHSATVRGAAGHPLGLPIAWRIHLTRRHCRCFPQVTSGTCYCFVFYATESNAAGSLPVLHVDGIICSAGCLLDPSTACAFAVCLLCAGLFFNAFTSQAALHQRAECRLNVANGSSERLSSCAASSQPSY